MNFRSLTRGGVTFTAEQQASAFEAYIAQDKYLSAHRGEYAERGAVFLPLLHKMDLSVTQDVFKNIKGKRNAGQFRIDIQNFGNLLNSDWGVGQRIIRNNILNSPQADAAGPLWATACRWSTTSWCATRSNQRAASATSTSSCSASGIRSTKGLRATGSAGLRRRAGHNDPPFFFSARIVL